MGPAMPFPRALHDAIGAQFVSKEPTVLNALREVAINDALSHSDVRRDFLAWASENANVVSSQPLLSRIVREVNDSSGYLQGAKGRVTWAFRRALTSNPCVAALEDLINHPPHGSRPGRFHVAHPTLSLNTDSIVPTLKAYDEAGLLSPDLLINFLSVGGGTPVSSLSGINGPSVLEGVMPLLRKNLSSDQLVSFLKQNTHIIGHLSRLNIMLPLIKDMLTGDQLFSILEPIGLSAKPADPKDLELLLPLLTKLSPEQLVILLQKKDGEGRTPLHYNESFKVLLPVLRDQLSPAQLILVLQTRNSRGTTPLDSSNRMQSILPILIAKLSVPQSNFQRAEIIAVLKTIDNDGNSFLHLKGAFIVPSIGLTGFSPAEIADLLSTKNAQGDTVLKKLYMTSSDFVKGSLKGLLAGLLPAERDRLMEITNNQGVSLKHLLTLQPSMTWLTKKKESLEPPRIMPEAYSGKTAELRQNMQDLVASISRGSPLYLEGRSFNEVNDALDILMQRIVQKEQWGGVPGDEAGLHRAYSDMAADLAILARELKQQNDPALTATLLTRITEAALAVPPSFEACSRAVKTALRSVYTQRVDRLTNDVQRRFNAVTFGRGAGEVNPIALGGQSKEAVLAAVQEMLRRMKIQMAWLGTPRIDQPEALSDFYHEMLENFEGVMRHLESLGDPEHMVGVLTSIAKAQLDGRCAAAYQGEIGQAMAVLGGAGVRVLNENVNDLVVRGTQMALRDTIERITREQYLGDTHAYNQFLYAFGFANTPDPIPPFTVEAAQQEIVAQWNVDYMLERFGSAIKKVRSEDLYGLLEERTPPTFNPAQVQLVNETRALEQRQLQQASTELSALGLPPAIIENLTKYFTSPIAITFGQSQPSPRSPQVAEALFRLDQAELQVAFRSTDGDAIWHLLRNKLSLSQRQAMPFRNECLQMADRNQHDPRNVVGRILRGAPNIDSIITQVLAIKTRFDEALTRLLSNNNIGFNAKFGLPSATVEHNRRQEYAQSRFDDQRRITQLGLIDLLVDQSVLDVRAPAAAAP